MAGPNGKIMHAEIKIGDSIVMLADENPQTGSDEPANGWRLFRELHVYVENVDAVIQKAVDNGAKAAAADKKPILWRSLRVLARSVRAHVVRCDACGGRFARGNAQAHDGGDEPDGRLVAIRSRRCSKLMSLRHVGIQRRRRAGSARRKRQLRDHQRVRSSGLRMRSPLATLPCHVTREARATFPHRRKLAGADRARRSDRRWSVGRNRRGARRNDNAARAQREQSVRHRTRPAACQAVARSHCAVARTWKLSKAM